jgi:hypothetical protein
LNALTINKVKKTGEKYSPRWMGNQGVYTVLKPKDILFGKSEQLRYDLTVVVVASVYPY